MKYIKAGIAVLLLVLLDQWTKVLAVRHSDEYRRHNIYTESFQIILSGKQRLCFWINAESKSLFSLFYSYHTGSFDVFLS